MYDIRTARPAELAAVVALVSRLQSDPAHMIGYHGESTGEVAEELAALRPGWTSCAVVAADRGGRLRGTLAVEVDHDQHRAHLYGPFVDVPANHPAAAQLWRSTADALFGKVLDLPVMAGVDTVDLFGHRENRLLADFAARHGAPQRMASRCFQLTGPPLRSLLVRGATTDDRVVRLPADQEVRDAVVSLHDRCFPNAPATGRQLVTSDRHTVVVLRADGTLLGYAAGFPQAEEYYVDTVAVDPAARDCGVGRTLVRRLLGELAAEAGPRDRAAAMIRTGNDASEHMFTKLGFTMELELVSYQAHLSAAERRPAV